MFIVIWQKVSKFMINKVWQHKTADCGEVTGVRAQQRWDLSEFTADTPLFKGLESIILHQSGCRRDVKWLICYICSILQVFWFIIVKQMKQIWVLWHKGLARSPVQVIIVISSSSPRPLRSRLIVLKLVICDEQINIFNINSTSCGSYTLMWRGSSLWSTI